MTKRALITGITGQDGSYLAELLLENGYENFLWPRQLRTVLEQAGAEIVEHRGIHLWPFQIKPLRAVSRWVDRFGDRLLPFMINQCLHCRKPMYNSSALAGHINKWPNAP